MSDKPSITNSTTMSVSIVISLLSLAFFMGVLWSRVNQIASNDEKGSSSTEKLIEENSRTRTDLATFSLRLDSFGERLDDFSSRLDNFSSQQSASTVRVVPTQSRGSLAVVRSQGMQPTGPQQQTIQPTTPAPEEPQPEEPEPETPEQPTGSLAGVIQGAVDVVLGVIGR